MSIDAAATLMHCYLSPCCAVRGLGTADDPRFVRFKGLNYVIVFEGDYTKSIVRLVKTKGGTYEQRIVCETKIRPKVKTSCRRWIDEAERLIKARE